MSLAAAGIWAAEHRMMPDAAVRAGIRRLCANRLRDLESLGSEEAALEAFARKMRSGPVAPVPEAANEQHYEVPASFYSVALGKHRKYSSCYWPQGVTTLDGAEAEALRVTCERAQLTDGIDILELGCGWGSLTLWMAEHYPASRITAVSNSSSQRAYIEAQAAERGLANITVLTRDMNDFSTDATFDRVVSIEMFEHMRNYELLLERIASWLKPDGRLFVHIFVHRAKSYEFMEEGASNWMGRHFFTGGIMPAVRIFDAFTRDLAVEQSWTWDGTHYQKTAEAWLENIDARRVEAIDALRSGGLDDAEARLMVNRWRMFFLACAETFGYAKGSEWFVGHYLLKPVKRAPADGGRS